MSFKLPRPGLATSLPGRNWLCAPHRAENFPAAVRKLLDHCQNSATNLLRLPTRRVDIRSRECTPCDGPAALQKIEVLRFRNIAQHLETFISRLAFVGRSDSLLADVRRRAYAEPNSVIGPQLRQRNWISRHRGGN